jgi:hypothetical protein
MRRRAFLTCLLALPAAVARADALPPPGPSGEVVSVDLAGSVIVLRLGRRERRARFTRLTRVRIRGMPGAVTDLRPGMRVTVRFAASESGRESDTLVSIDA